MFLIGSMLSYVAFAVTSLLPSFAPRLISPEAKYHPTQQINDCNAAVEVDDGRGHGCEGLESGRYKKDEEEGVEACNESQERDCASHLLMEVAGRTEPGGLWGRQGRDSRAL